MPGRARLGSSVALEVVGPNLCRSAIVANVIAHRLVSVAKGPSSPSELREAVERTVQVTLGSAERQRERTQGALDDLAGTVDQLRKEAGAGIARRGKAVVGALEDRRPATSEDIRELKSELRGSRAPRRDREAPAGKASASGAGSDNRRR